MKILFIGNRINVLQQLLSYKEYDVDIFAQEKSYLSAHLHQQDIKHYLFGQNQKELIIDMVRQNKHDVIISNGCPFILPVVHDRIYNIHPTYLPHLRGKTPLNGVILKQIGFLGSTMHRVSSKIDGGNIIYQQKVSIGSDIDLGLVYYMSFQLEGTVFLKGWKKLIAHDFQFEGKPMNLSDGSYYNRNEHDAMIDFKTMNGTEILLRIKSFGIKTQGTSPCGLHGSNIKKIFDAELIFNEYLNTIFSDAQAGDVVHSYDEKLLIKTIDGLIKITSYE